MKGKWQTNTHTLKKFPHLFLAISFVSPSPSHLSQVLLSLCHPSTIYTYLTFFLPLFLFMALRNRISSSSFVFVFLFVMFGECFIINDPERVSKKENNRNRFFFLFFSVSRSFKSQHHSLNLVYNVNV